MAFDYAEFKAKWRQLAAEKGVDPINGATTFQAVIAQAEERSRTHIERQKRAVFANAQTHTPEDSYHMHEHVQLKNSNSMSATPRLKAEYYSHWDNGKGAVDYVRVEQAARRDWWADPDLWVGGGRAISIHKPVSKDQENIVGHIPPTDYEAIENIRREAEQLENQHQPVSRAEDKDAMWKEAWEEDRARRERQKRSPVEPVQATQLAFAFAS